MVINTNFGANWAEAQVSYKEWFLVGANYTADTTLASAKDADM